MLSTVEAAAVVGGKNPPDDKTPPEEDKEAGEGGDTRTNLDSKGQVWFPSPLGS